MDPNVRRQNETQRNFKARRRMENWALRHRKGRLLWDSLRRGTYRRHQHGPLR